MQVPLADQERVRQLDLDQPGQVIVLLRLIDLQIAPLALPDPVQTVETSVLLESRAYALRATAADLDDLEMEIAPALATDLDDLEMEIDPALATDLDDLETEIDPALATDLGALGIDRAADLQIGPTDRTGATISRLVTIIT